MIYVTGQDNFILSSKTLLPANLGPFLRGLGILRLSSLSNSALVPFVPQYLEIIICVAISIMHQCSLPFQFSIVHNFSHDFIFKHVGFVPLVVPVLAA